MDDMYLIYLFSLLSSLYLYTYLLKSISLWIKKQEGASKEDIEQLSKFKFRKVENDEKQTGNIEGPAGGIMTECRADSPIEHVLAEEDAVCYKHLLLVSLIFSPFSNSHVALILIIFFSLYFNGKSIFKQTWLHPLSLYKSEIFLFWWYIIYRNVASAFLLMTMELNYENFLVVTIFTVPVWINGCI